MAATPERPFPPGDYPVVVVGSGPGGLQSSYFLGRHGIDHAVHLGRSVAGRHVPPLPVLPAAALVDQAARAVPAADPRVRVVRLEQPAGRRGRQPLGDARPDGRHVRVPVTTRDGARPRHVRRACRRPRPARHHLGVDLARRRAVRAPHERWRLPRRHGDLRGRRRGTVDAQHARRRARRPLRRNARRRHLRGQAPLHHRQAEQRLRAGQRAAAVGEPDHPRLAAARAAVGQHALAGRRPGALRPAVGGLEPGRRRVHPQRVDRADRAHR